MKITLHKKLFTLKIKHHHVADKAPKSFLVEQISLTKKKQKDLLNEALLKKII